MASEVHGKGGDLKVAGSSVSGVKNWSVKYNQTAAEVTNFTDAGVKRFIAGGSGWSGSFTASKTGVPLDIITLNAANSGAGAAFIGYEVAASGTKQWAGNIIITDVSPKVDIKGVVEYSYSFTGNGALTIPTA